MITLARIEGYRSLIGFEIRLQTGLNVLVGANGSGKSNFISFLDFLSEFMQEDLNSAIAVAQGAGSVFSREMFSNDEARLRFEIFGQWKKPAEEDIFVRHPDDSKSGDYVYRCTIRYLRHIPTIYVEHEHVQVTSNAMPEERIDIERFTSSQGRDFDTDVKFSAPKRLTDDGIFKFSTGTHNARVSMFKDRLSPERSILQHVHFETFSLMGMHLDLTSFRSININPTAARRPTPVGSTITLQPTGEGLAGALYQIKRGNYIPRYALRRYWLGNKLPAPDFLSILSWCREVNGAINDIDVKLEFMEAQMLPQMTFKHDNTETTYPFSKISDGTVKWLALVTILLSEPDLKLIEEPENFLHPLMQETFITLCREVITNSSDRSIIVSTHSPTLLNCCYAAELTIFDLMGGHSRASKVANRLELQEKISSSRFGLGYFYRTGALYGEDRSAG